MSSWLEYHVSVRHSIPASVAFLSLLVLLVVLVSSAHAQINGASASGFGGRAINGPSASVTLLGPSPRRPRLATAKTILTTITMLHPR